MARARRRRSGQTTPRRRRSSNAERSRQYRQRFAERHGGVSFNAAGRLARQLGLKPGSRSAAVRRVSTTTKGAELLSYTGPDPRRQALADVGLRGADWRSRTFAAAADLREGRYTTAAEAEAHHGLPTGTIRRELGSTAALGVGTDAPMVMRIMGFDVGPVYRVTESKEERQFVGDHWHAIGVALSTGNDAPLRRFEGVKVAGVRLETRLEVLQGLWERGDLAGGPYPELRGGEAMAA